MTSAPRKDGCIRYGRGILSILDRQSLGAVACECYGVTRAPFDTLLR